MPAPLSCSLVLARVMVLSYLTLATSVTSAARAASGKTRLAEARARTSKRRITTHLLVKTGSRWAPMECGSVTSHDRAVQSQSHGRRIVERDGFVPLLHFCDVHTAQANQGVARPGSMALAGPAHTRLRRDTFSRSVPGLFRRGQLVSSQALRLHR